MRFPSHHRIRTSHTTFHISSSSHGYTALRRKKRLSCRVRLYALRDRNKLHRSKPPQAGYTLSTPKMNIYKRYADITPPCSTTHPLQARPALARLQFHEHTTPRGERVWARYGRANDSHSCYETTRSGRCVATGLRTSILMHVRYGQWVNVKVERAYSSCRLSAAHSGYLWPVGAYLPLWTQPCLVTLTLAT